ncbi:MAG: SDR family oxidoreductase [Fusobacterium gastrosuis]|uniref:SDR family oxidoreductase n=1 Tax=Fusobacterium gastrosuis TaxID=1755100 RepID=UPI002A88D9E7|nr:SDR family oxidoreductase [Fusobacterium gastrosuis]
MKILVMGGNQFLGKALTEKLLAQKYEVFVLNRGSRKNLTEATHIKVDRDNYNELEEKLKNFKFDIIVDISAYTGLQVKNFYQIMKGKFKQYILISSASIYNNTKEFPVSEASSIGENTIWGDYAKNKYLAEQEAIKMEENYTIFRPFYIYGIGNNLDREQYVFSRIENKFPIYLPDEGENIIQFGYIDDLVSAVIYSFNNKKFHKEIFNISGDESISIESFVKLCAKVMNKEVDIKYIQCNEKIKARDWFPFRNTDLYGSIEKIKLTGFKNKYSLEKGLMKTYKYLKDNALLRKINLNKVEKSF